MVLQFRFTTMFMNLSLDKTNTLWRKNITVQSNNQLLIELFPKTVYMVNSLLFNMYPVATQIYSAL